MVDRSPGALLFVAVAVLLLVGSIVGLAVTSTTPSRVDAGGSSPTSVPANASLDAIHAAGVTGANVTVGVVDVTGFDRSASTLDGRIRGARAFGDDATVAADGSTHGTAAARTVAAVAPGAGLYLASFDGTDDFARAVRWLVARDVDVVVAPVSFYGRAGDGHDAVSAVAATAHEAGVVFVAPTGNVARGHWRGAYDRVDDGRLAFDVGPRNYLRGDRGRLSVWLSWSDPAEDYSVDLYWTNGETSSRVATSRRFAGDRPTERIVTRVGAGTYYLVVRGPDQATGTSLRLVSPTHEFQRYRPRGSVLAPAMGRGVLGVGAYDRAADRVARYSSRGPTADGRRGVNLVGPADPTVASVPDRFAGSSAATAYVGGVVALVRGTDPDAPPRAVERRLRAAAVDVGANGSDTASGRGLVDARTAARATNATRTSPERLLRPPPIRTGVRLPTVGSTAVEATDRG
jgi:hypothetical protein